MRLYKPIPLMIVGMNFFYSITGCAQKVIVKESNELSQEQTSMVEAALQPERWLLRKIRPGDVPSAYIGNEGIEPYNDGNKDLYNRLSRLHPGNKPSKGPKIGEDGELQFGSLVSLLTAGDEMCLLDINGDGLVGPDYNKKENVFSGYEW